jgi:UDP-glucose 4-epimerase
MLDDIEIVEGDIRSYERVHTAVKGCEVVLHQAALPSVRRVVVASSSSVYGATPGLPKVEDMPLLPFSPYAAAKQAGESYCRAFSEVYGLETVALR